MKRIGPRGWCLQNFTIQIRNWLLKVVMLSVEVMIDRFVLIATWRFLGYFSKLANLNGEYRFHFLTDLEHEFRKRDKDRSGTIDCSELEECLQLCGILPTREDILTHQVGYWSTWGLGGRRGNVLLSCIMDASFVYMDAFNGYKILNCIYKSLTDPSHGQLRLNHVSEGSVHPVF